ncbi:AmmeMemoRadiSam system protein B [Chloroflexota bacterium]
MKPKLREIRTQPAAERGQQGIILTDPLGISLKKLFIPNSVTLLLNLIDGTRDIGTLRTGFELRTGRTVGNAVVEQLLSQLDEALFLENDKFQLAHKEALDSYRSSPTRPLILAGSCYPENPEELKSFIKKYLDQADGEPLQEAEQVVGAISPHIDYQRGGHIYAEVWSKMMAILPQAELVIILGTDHNDGKGMVTLTRQNYETPLGTVPTAKDIVEELASEIGDDSFAVELNHRGEHSIEAALIWLHYILGDKICPVVPILCGSFQGLIEQGESPLTAKQIVSTINILRKVYQRQRTVVIAAADLAHMGPAFGDPIPLDIVGRAKMAKYDEELIQVLCQGDADNLYSLVQREKDRRHVCGLPPIFITLASIASAQGISAGYAQCPASADQTSLVSICGIVYLDKKNQQ